MKINSCRSHREFWALGNGSKRGAGATSQTNELDRFGQSIIVLRISFDYAIDGFDPLQSKKVQGLWVN